jgi:IS5 family transposase
MRRFAGLSLARGAVPDETTILNFRHLLERHGLTREIFEAVKEHLEASGLLLRQGTIVDATIVSAPSSTKNADKARDPEMHQTRKGNQWYFGMKAHVGVDAESGLVHSVIGTAANVADVTQAHDLLHGDEAVAFGDAGYTGVEHRAEGEQQVEWHVAMKRGKRRMLDATTEAGRLRECIERLKAQVRARGEHAFRVIERQFGYVKVRYRGLAKNTAQLHTLFALANIWMVRRPLLATA